MDGIGAAIEAALKWVTDDRKLRTALITIVVFGLLAAALEHYQIAKGISHDWFLSVYAAAVLATLLLTVAVFDLAVVKIYSKYRMSRKKKEEAEAVANFSALPLELKLHEATGYP